MFRNHKIRILAISILLCLAYGLWLAPLKPARIANLKILDLFFSISSRFGTAPRVAQDIVVVTIDDESLREIGMQWPWPRSVLAQLISKISESSPSLICIDLVFSGKSADPREDAALIDSFKGSKNIVAAAYFGSDGRYMIPSEEIASGLKDFGFVNKPRDIDNTIRRMRPYYVSTSGDIIDYSLSLKVASILLNVPPAGLSLMVPLSKEGVTYIKFFGTLNKFNRISAWKIMKDGADISILKNKSVFLGVTSESFHDTYHTPLGMMPGVMIDLNESLTYINRSFFRYANHEMNALILFVFVLMAVFAGLRLSMLSGILFTASEIVLFVSFGMLLFLRNVIIDSFGPMLMIITSTVLLHGARYALMIGENIVLRKEAVTDGLTQLYLYRYFEMQLKRELKRAFYMRSDLALVIYDIDHFKKINDNYGHEFGNIVLKAVAKSLKDHSRKNNIIARYGGEEFCIIVPGMKRDHAVKYAERLRNLVSFLEFKTDKGEKVKITMSAGLVMAEDALSDNPSDFVKAADAALYRSKDNGRDRISVFDKNTDSSLRGGL